MHQVLKKSLIIFLIILFAAIIGWTFLGMYWKEGFSGAAQEKINNMYSANVIFANSIYSIVITDSNNVPIATFYTNPVTLATLSNISSVTFSGESSDSLWNSSKATITIDTVGNTYTVTCTLTDGTLMTFVGPYSSTPTVPASTPATSPSSDAGSTDSSSSTDDSNSTSNYENYNHFNGSSYPTMFYGPNGGTAQIMNAAGVYTIVLTDSNGKTVTYTAKKESSKSGHGNGNMNVITKTTWQGPKGTTATVVSGSNGNYLIKIVKSDGTTTIYYPTHGSSSHHSSHKNNNLHPTQNPTPKNWQSWADWFNSNSSQNSSQNQNNQYSNYLPDGIPASAIPPGSEDLYILKSEVVPPVCPVCPTANCKSNNKKCPPCPACARCPEPAFDCKKVPNYSSMNDSILPQAVLPGYSTFGM
jgi:hypothetical protein